MTIALGGCGYGVGCGGEVWGVGGWIRVWRCGGVGGEVRSGHCQFDGPLNRVGVWCWLVRLLVWHVHLRAAWFCPAFQQGSLSKHSLSNGPAKQDCLKFAHLIGYAYGFYFCVPSCGFLKNKQPAIKAGFFLRCFLAKIPNFIRHHWTLR